LSCGLCCMEVTYEGWRPPDADKFSGIATLVGAPAAWDEFFLAWTPLRLWRLRFWQRTEPAPLDKQGLHDIGQSDADALRGDLRRRTHRGPHSCDARYARTDPEARTSRPRIVDLGCVAAYRHHWWPLPTRAGDELRVESEVLEVGPSSARAAQGAEDDAEPERRGHAGSPRRSDRAPPRQVRTFHQPRGVRTDNPNRL
jgi:hypothetical protein